MRPLRSVDAYKRILYHHRTQGQGVEGVHIRGMVEELRNQGYRVDVVSPPKIDPFKTAENPAQPSSDKESFFKYFWHKYKHIYQGQ